MRKLSSSRAVCCAAATVFGLCLATAKLGFGQVASPETSVEVHDLPSLTATSHDHSAVLLTSLDTIIHDKSICCGRDSALVDAAQAADPDSLKDIASKLEGRHLMGDGRPIKVTTEVLTPDQIGAGHLVAMIEQQHPALMIWNSHLYVVHGTAYIRVTSNTEGVTAEVPVIRKILLWDTRFSGSRREVVFDRATADISKVEGLLFVLWAQQ